MTKHELTVTVTNERTNERITNHESQNNASTLSDGQIHIDGLFNGDPHPGNILIQSTNPEGGAGGARGRNGVRISTAAAAVVAAVGEGGARGEAGGVGDGSKKRKTALPVLLDWGLAKTLPERQRIAFSRCITRS